MWRREGGGVTDWGDPYRRELVHTASGSGLSGHVALFAGCGSTEWEGRGQ